MKENEYILVTNLVKVTAALNILRDILPDSDGVVTAEERKKILSTLSKWQEKAYKKIKVQAES